jgi:L-2-hydroxyglutarate oxidase
VRGAGTQPDVVVIGAGIVGLATALALLRRSRGSARVRVIEKEAGPAHHQTGRNSGVIHSGLYYVPGSAKARQCREGRTALIEFCREHDVAHDLCGKVVVATTEEEVPGLDALAERGRANGVTLERIGQDELQQREPACRGLGALFVADTGIVDYRGVADALVRRIRELGGVVDYDTRLLEGRDDGSRVHVRTSSDAFEAGHLINCAGLHSDRVAKACGVRPSVRIVPFRGDYYALAPEHAHLCRNLIYPVPDPAFPFLGVHLTRMIEGGVECGPSAVLAFAREGYTPTMVNARDLWDTLTTPGFWRLARRHVRTGVDEMLRTFSRARFAAALQRLVPAIEPAMLRRAPAGVRAQALAADGRLVDDFAVERTDRMVHVLNAPSPAATAALAIGDAIVQALPGS